MTPSHAKALALVAVGRIEANSAVEQQQRDHVRQTMLTDDEAESLISAIMRRRGERGATETEVLTLVNECMTMRLLSSCVDLAVKGLVDVDIDLSKPVNEQIAFFQRKDIEGEIRAAIKERGQDVK